MLHSRWRSREAHTEIKITPFILHSKSYFRRSFTNVKKFIVSYPRSYSYLKIKINRCNSLPATKYLHSTIWGSWSGISLLLLCENCVSLPGKVCGNDHEWWKCAVLCLKHKFWKLSSSSHFTNYDFTIHKSDSAITFHISRRI